MALDRQASCPWLQINQKERRGQMQREGGDNFLNKSMNGVPDAKGKQGTD